MLSRKDKNHPVQPLVIDDHGVLRFKSNGIVRYLMDNGGIDMNKIAMLDFSQEDREQFAELIGYSHSGFADLSYVSDEVWCIARDMHEKGLTEESAELEYLRGVVRKLMVKLGDIVKIVLGEEDGQYAMESVFRERE